MIEPRIIYENKDFSVIDKPAGLQVHPAKISEKQKWKKGNGQNVERGTLVDWLAEKYPEIKSVGDDPELRPGIMHRLDKETSGVMIVARNQKYFEYLKSLFSERKIQKKYIALVYGKLQNKEGIIDAPIGIKSGTLKRSIHSKKMLKEAITEYKTVKVMTVKDGDGKEKIFSLLEVYPKTGRTHQIRVHLASIGHPIVGDKLYGSKKDPQSSLRLMLHAKSISFDGTSGTKFEFEAEPPREFSKSL